MKRRDFIAFAIVGFMFGKVRKPKEEYKYLTATDILQRNGEAKYYWKDYNLKLMEYSKRDVELTLKFTRDMMTWEEGISLL